jgi:hypothetical protein
VFLLINHKCIHRFGRLGSQAIVREKAFPFTPNGTHLQPS